ncbi:XRE family transcriptional regulator [Hyphococcus formosus]|uniref:helix-turn-helix domain-containing protein n=1 Tax=Hyphococcus formosus TaxID=3143534 RepID=UPI00398AFE0C
MSELKASPTDILQSAVGPAGESQPRPTIQLGKKIRELRRSKGWTLEDVASATGLAASTLSKIENDRMSPTFDVVQKLAHGFSIDITDLFSSSATTPPQARRSIVRQGQGRLLDAQVYSHQLLAAELKRKQILPFLTTVKARSIDEFKEWGSHDGEEFMYVLEGSVRFYTEHYEPAELEAGDGVYIDSAMRHACISTSKKDAKVLWINTG